MRTSFKHYLFVYGTLAKQSGHPMHGLLRQYTEFVSSGYIHGRLYDLGLYPAAILSAADEDKVFGEIYTITNEKRLLEQLDDYEECSSSFPQPHEYKRQIVTVKAAENAQYQAWCYLYNRSLRRANRIASGRYF